MTTFQAIILGAFQGLTEFLPVSSSGHLILIPYLFGWNLQSVVFDIAVHFGTACAVLIYFYREWLNMLIAIKNDLADFAKSKTFGYNKLRPGSKLLLTIVAVTIPVGLIGMLFENYVEDFFRSGVKVAAMLIVTSFFMLYAEFKSKEFTTKTNLNFIDSLIISLSQLLALIPGASRSGMTISTGLLLSYERSKVASFSFLLATPLILAAALLHIKDILSLDSAQLVNFIIGFFTSFIFGYASISFLIKFLQKNSLKIFIWYRILLGVSVLLLVLLTDVFKNWG